MSFTKRSRLLLLALVAGGAVVGPPSVAPVSAASSGLVLVVGKSSPINNITKAELNRLFSADPIKVEGQAVVPFALTPSSADRQAFDLIVLGMGPEEVNKFWIDRRIRGQGNPPKSAPSPEVVAKVVANFPGALGYVPVGSLTPALKPVAIDGKTYLDPGYLLAQAH
jgi:ABC-type phosphate transport system substrate-binding protein